MIIRFIQQLIQRYVRQGSSPANICYSIFIREAFYFNAHIWGMRVKQTIYKQRWSVAVAVAVLLTVSGFTTTWAIQSNRQPRLERTFFFSTSIELLRSPSQVGVSQPITSTEKTTTTGRVRLKFPTLPALTNPLDDQKTEKAAEESSADGSAIDTLEDVELAVVQIEAIGSFRDPVEGMQRNAAGSGSGFIIDESGIAVTNNHVVAGAAFLKVFVAGEEQALNAKVLGVSECADLAVIDIQGNGFSYLEWFEGDIKVGLDVYAAGFPLGDPEYTLTRGIVSKARADGRSRWASVQRVLQHDATINPGNSGGPLVDKDGKVVAVNYAGNDETVQYFAISRDDAVPIIEELGAGNDIDSIGINGRAIWDEEGNTGIWVASIASGSPADEIGLKAGDIVITLEGIEMATDGTMADYCNVLRSNSPGDVLAVQVIRNDTQEVLEGQVNGRPLEQSFSFANQLAENSEQTLPNRPNQSEAVNEDVDGYEEFTTISDESGTLTLDVPAAWSDLQDGAWTINDQEIGVHLIATPNLDDFFNSWGTPGVFFAASAEIVSEQTQSDLLDGIDYSDSCTYDGRSELPTGFYRGAYDIWSQCDGTDSSAMIVSMMPETEDFIVLMEVYISSQADLLALDHILDSFVVDSTPVFAASRTAATASNLETELKETVETDDLVYDYHLVQDPALNALLPKEWSDVESSDWVLDGEVVGRSLVIAPDVEQYRETWTTPGLYVRTSSDFGEDIDPTEFISQFDLEETCEYNDQIEREHTILEQSYSAVYDIWVDCEGTGNIFVVLAATPETKDQIILMQYQAATEADVEAFNVMMESFFVGLEETSSADFSTSGGTATRAYVDIVDETGTIQMSVPEGWSDVLSDDWIVDDTTLGISISAAPDLEEFNSSWNTPGMFMGVSNDLSTTFTPDELLDLFKWDDDCTYNDRFDYGDKLYAGAYDIWTDCGGRETIYIVMAVTPKEGGEPMILLNVQLADSSDVESFEQILDTFTVATTAGSSVSPSAAPTAVLATVQVSALNVRSGPGTNYSPITTVSRNDSLTVIGQNNNCAWLQIVTPDGTEGWISGGAQYVTREGDCDAVPAVVAPTQSTSNQAPTTSSRANTSTGKGCYLFQNQLGAEVNITMTRSHDGWNQTFKVPKGTEKEECFDPGKYTYTLDAPPPWGSTNDEITVNAGDRLLFPLRGE